MFVFHFQKNFGGSRRCGAGLAGFAGGNAPPILFLAPQKENGPCTVQEKKRPRWGCLSVFRKVSARGVDGAWVWRSWIPSASISACAPCSVGGARRAGLSSTSSDDRRSVNAGGNRFEERDRRAPAEDRRIGGTPLERPPYLSELARMRKFRASVFSLGRLHRPFSFCRRKKRMGGGIPCI